MLEVASLSGEAKERGQGRDWQRRNVEDLHGLFELVKNALGL